MTSTALTLMAATLIGGFALATAPASAATPTGIQAGTAPTSYVRMMSRRDKMMMRKKMMRRKMMMKQKRMM